MKTSIAQFVGMYEQRLMVSYNELARRAALPVAPLEPSVEDQLGWAELCLDSGAGDAARMLFQTAFIRQGFSPELRAAQESVAKRVGLWSEPAATGPPAAAGGWTTDIALAEISNLSRALAREHSPRLPHETSPKGFGRPDSFMRDAIAPAQPTGDVADLVDGLWRFLSDPVSADVRMRGANMLTHLENACRGRSRFDFRAFVTAPLPLLAAAISFSSLQAFVRDNRDLAAPPLGSPALLHTAAQLSWGGLGAYFRNIGNVVRSSRDVFQLARAARGVARDGSDDVLYAWVVLLTRQAPELLFYEVMDDLGDLGAMPAIAALLDCVVSRSEAQTDPRLVGRLRDVALDNGDYGLAARAQAIVAALDPALPHERVILGSILASGGDLVAAERVLLECLATTPGDIDARERLRALRSGSFAPFRIEHGFASPSNRLFNRLARRGLTPRGRPGEARRVTALQF